MKKLAILLSLVLVAALALPVTALAAEQPQGRIIIGDNFVLENGETLDGDLLVIGGNVTLKQDSLVDGDVFAIGGNVDVSGEVSGDIGVIGGQVTLEDEAVVRGNVSALGGWATRKPGAQIEGEFTPGSGFQVPFDFSLRGGIKSFPRAILAPISGFGVYVPGFFRVGTKLFNAFLMAALAVLAVVFWPEPTRRVAMAAVDQPLPAGGLGLLTLIVGPVLLILLLITIILSPLSLVGLVVLVAAWAFGVIGIGLEVGDRLAQALKWEIQPPVAAGLGTLLLSLIVAGLGLVDCIGWAPRILLGALAVGSVIMTRFGSRPYVPIRAQAAPVELESTEQEDTGE